MQHHPPGASPTQTVRQAGDGKEQGAGVPQRPVFLGEGWQWLEESDQPEPGALEKEKRE